MNLKSLFVTLCICISLSNKVLPQSITVDRSQIKDVKVFFMGAEITRNFTASIPQGKSEIKIINLSSSLDPNSIVINSNPSLKIISLHSGHDAKNKLKNDLALKLISDSIEMYQSRLKLKKLKSEALLEEKKALLVNSVRAGNTQGLSLSEMDQISAYIRKKQDEINTQIITTEEETSGIERKLSEMKERKSELEKIDESAVTNITLLVENPSAQKINFTLSYYVKSCGWAPSYNLYSRGIGNPLEMEYKGNIFNNSGEDWNNVSLSLLAGNPTRSLNLPVMETWSLSYRQRRGKSIGYNEYGDEGNLSTKQIKNGNLSGAQNETQEIEVEEGELSFTVEGLHSIPSANNGYLADINKTTLDASYLYKTIPKLESKAYLIAKVKDWEKLKLIEGSANIFSNGTFIGRTYIDPLAAGDTLDISLGPDPNIQISRVKKKDFSTKKLIGLQLLENFTYEIDIRNLNNKPVYIEVADQVPIAQQEEIQINLEEKTGAEHDAGNGKLTWKLEVPVGQTVKLKLGYSVKFPRDKVVLIKRTGRVMCPKFR